MAILNVTKTLVRRSSDGKYLILTGSDWPERPDRSHKPDLPGGAVEDSESCRTGAIRELQEETGIVVSAAELSLVYAESLIDDGDPANPRGINRLIYWIELPGEPEVVLSWEHESYTWLTGEEVLALDDYQQPYPTIFRYLAQIGVLNSL